MTITLIAAMGKGRVIGEGNTLPWRLPADMRHFRKTTEGYPIIMGRKTFESILAQRGGPLPNRFNIVLTRSAEAGKKCLAAGCDAVAGSVEESLEMAEEAAKKTGSERIFVIGGAEIYAAFLPMADEMQLTFIDGEFSGDVLFPEYRAGEWEEVSRDEHPEDEENPYPYTFVTLKRKE